MPLVLGFGAILAGAVLVITGVTGSSLASVVKGQPDKSKATTPATTTPGSAVETTASGTNLAGRGNQPGNKTAFAKAFAAATGLNEQVIMAWLNHEQGSSTVEGGNNWLNIETGSRGGSGPHSPEARYVESLSPEAAAQYTANWLRKNIPSITNSAGHSPAEQVLAIENSGYAASHYEHLSPSAFLAAAG